MSSKMGVSEKLDSYRRWILVAGSSEDLTDNETYAAVAVGNALRKSPYGLITGKWPGVDTIVANAFTNPSDVGGVENPQDRFIQVIRGDSETILPDGHIVRVGKEAGEWLVPQSYADAVILIGGKDGAYMSWLSALQAGIPRFPLGGTGPDVPDRVAKEIFEKNLKYYEMLPIAGVSKEQFEKLSFPIRDPSSAKKVIDDLFQMIPSALYSLDGQSRKSLAGQRSLFLSYSHKDRKWVEWLRMLLRPYERRGLFTTWIDVDMEPGLPWEAQLLRQIDVADAALALVSRNFLNSQYIRTTELPRIVERAKAKGSSFHLFWTLVETLDEHYLSTLDTLYPFQAIGDPATGFSDCGSDADAGCRLLEIARDLIAALSPNDAVKERKPEV